MASSAFWRCWWTLCIGVASLCVNKGCVVQNVASDAFTFEAWVRTNDFCHRGETDYFNKPRTLKSLLWLDFL